MRTLDGMTWDIWKSLPEREKEALRDNSDLTPCLMGLEGYRVEVVEGEEERPRRFNVGKSTGWKPVHLEVHNSRSLGGSPAAKHYGSLKVIRKAR